MKKIILSFVLAALVAATCPAANLASAGVGQFYTIGTNESVYIRRN